MDEERLREKRFYTKDTRIQEKDRNKKKQTKTNKSGTSK